MEHGEVRMLAQGNGHPLAERDQLSGAFGHLPVRLNVGCGMGAFSFDQSVSVTIDEDLMLT